jgi:hypothetical protein
MATKTAKEVFKVDESLFDFNRDRFSYPKQTNFAHVCLGIQTNKRSRTNGTRYGCGLQDLMMFPGLLDIPAPQRKIRVAV